MKILTQALWFPNPDEALRGEHNGLLAVGGDLSVERLRLAYRSGIFPWTVDPITWWSPDPRAVFEWEKVKICKSLDKLLKKQPFQFSRDKAFREVMLGCAESRRGRETTWVVPEFLDAYCELHAAGVAHSFECWRDGVLVGGVYGVQIGGFFAGESMFHRESNASKAALVELLRHLERQGFELFDTQVINPTTLQMGAIEIRRKDYLERLAKAIQKPCVF
ncbi:MAG: leucyl/phenylalanyl-tRNA--protein transferase [Verrucomicrobia bacterium]|nr:leucyl/phenylalanyl-tRNA--protein transferase [Verrucomicrobiota bacterium]